MRKSGHRGDAQAGSDRSIDIPHLLRLHRKKAWAELAAAMTAHPHLVRLERTTIRRVEHVGPWNQPSGAFGMFDDPKALASHLERHPDLRSVASLDECQVGQLHHRAAAHPSDALQVLLDAGFGPDDPTCDSPITGGIFPGGNPPLFHAIVNKNIRNAALLLRYGANIRLQDWSGAHALHVTAAKGHTEETIWLLEHGADANVQDETGRTPLHAAARRTSSTRTLEALLAFGADRAKRDHQGRTALDWAREAGKAKNVALLA